MFNKISTNYFPQRDHKIPNTMFSCTFGLSNRPLNFLRPLKKGKTESDQIAFKNVAGLVAS